MMRETTTRPRTTIAAATMTSDDLRPERMQQAAEHQRAEPLADEEAAGEEGHGRAAGRGRELGRLGLHRVVQHVEGEAGAEHRRGVEPPERRDRERGVAGGGAGRAEQAHPAHAEPAQQRAHAGGVEQAADAEGAEDDAGLDRDRVAAARRGREQQLAHEREQAVEERALEHHRGVQPGRLGVGEDAAVERGERRRRAGVAVPRRRPASASRRRSPRPRRRRRR